MCFDDDAGGKGNRSSGRATGSTNSANDYSSGDNASCDSRATVSTNSANDYSSGDNASCDSDSRTAWCGDGARWKRRERQSGDGSDDESDDGNGRRVACDGGT